MKNISVLAALIGNTDLKAMAQSQKLPDALTSQMNSMIRDFGTLVDGVGPIKTLTQKLQFEEIFLLSNYSEEINKEFEQWLGQKSSIKKVELADPSSYPDVFSIVDQEMESFLGGLKQPVNLSIHLSPGTPTMAAIWVLLGKTRYQATFYQTYKNECKETKIPFKILDVVPDLLSRSDLYLQQFLERSPQEVEGFQDILGNSPQIRMAIARASKASVRDVPILLMGESGTGKELFARAIHQSSRRRDKIFEVINCAAIPTELLESEFFGHIKGSFTGAVKDSKGAFERADGGTLFLDEIGECPLALQAKLLRALQPVQSESPCIRSFRPIGAEKEVKSNIRIIAATNRNLIQSFEKNLFREDLYYRLAVITIKLPPLRERLSDINKIAESLLRKINQDFENQEPGYKHKSISKSALSFLKEYTWKGNVRELYNALLQAAVMSNSDRISQEDLYASIPDIPNPELKTPSTFFYSGEKVNLEQKIDELQKQYIESALQKTGNLSQAAELLMINSYQTLQSRLKQLGGSWDKQQKKIKWNK